MIDEKQRGGPAKTAIWNLGNKTMERRIDGGGHEDVIKHQMSRTLDTRQCGLSGTGARGGEGLKRCTALFSTH